MVARPVYSNWNKVKKPSFSISGADHGARAVISWAVDTYGDDLVYACSFGAESAVLIEMLAEAKPDARLIFLDTGLHFPETLELIQRVEKRYPRLVVERLKPDLTLEEQAKQHGDALWQREPDQCCRIRKVLPLERALKGVPAWISGLRREQSPTRRFTSFLNQDERFQSIKVCPLIHWTWEDVWAFIRERDLPVNPLHHQGYPSIGCVPCTRAVKDGEDLRAGRWTGSEKTECGLHS
ncbi:phosphoadenylyl-sulfate reductase [Desmospora profundinema]|uniref:Adenosine 5'-phosphosulfate reductase n=1 Tax=Desmospora profundinema TaxID=1571184 RepID=A0ABU1IPB8_9BACL|nr:phosphoadenylyl-sulfate reductase [Desmospora profundinema]MDR6226637.1 phosphoadenosine phosphosulfate reductase [Desmospora profundinema]